MFNIPIVLFTFKRDKVLQIISVLSEIKPQKLYLISDYGRNFEEKKEIDKLRVRIEKAINWDCEIIKNYANENRGVYGNIALGSKWVLKQEKWAIFLEDDNLPDLTFFEFCKQMLIKYEENEKVLWICGTNYLGKYNSEYSYVFTQHLLPCGWASWSKKFLKFYDENMENYSDESGRKKAINRFVDKKLARQYSYFWREEYQRAKQNVRPVSWDYQMDFCLKYNDLYGICPTVNQIKNIGIDQDSIHGGIDKKGEMTLRFCEIETFPIKFPLKHPNTVKIDLNFENEIAKILLYPFKLRVKNFFSHRIRKIFNIPGDISVRNYFKGLGRC